MDIKILHLYGDIMNLYGEYANVSALARALSAAGNTVSVTDFSIKDSFSLSGYDFYYMERGTERNKYIVQSHLLEHRQELADEAENGKIMLFTGNSWEILGKESIDRDGNAHEGLGLFDFTVSEGKKRITCDALGKSEYFGCEIIGFINKCSKIQSSENPFVTLSLGMGNDNTSPDEGLISGNVFGTHIIGPVLIKNPPVLSKICKLITGSDAEFSCSQYAQSAYELSLLELHKRL